MTVERRFAKILKLNLKESEKTLVSEKPARLLKGSRLMKHELSALRLEFSKLRAAARHAEVMKNAEVSG